GLRGRRDRHGGGPERGPGGGRRNRRCRLRGRRPAGPGRARPDGPRGAADPVARVARRGRRRARPAARGAAAARDRGRGAGEPRRARAHREPRGGGGAGQRSRPGTPGAAGRGPGGPAGTGAARGRGVPRTPHPRGGGGLRGGTESRAADRRHRALLVGALDRGLRDAAQRDRVFGGGTGRGGTAPRRALPRGRPGRTRRGGGDTDRPRGRQAMTTEPAAPRQSRIERNTKETQIVLTLNLDGTGAAKVDTGIPFFNHMLEAWSKHALMDLAV